MASSNDSFFFEIYYSEGTNPLTNFLEFSVFSDLSDYIYFADNMRSQLKWCDDTRFCIFSELFIELIFH